MVRRLFPLLAMVVTSVAAAQPTPLPRPGSPSARPGAALTRRPVLARTVPVRGYLAVFVPSGQRLMANVARASTAALALPTRGHDVYVPGVRVFLREVNNATAVSTADETDLSGRFTVRARPDVRYRLCWESKSLGSACGADTITPRSTPTFLSTVRISWKPDGAPAVWGSVRNADGSLPRFLDPVAGINSFATVHLLDSNGKAVDRAYVNNFGEYFLPRVPGKERIRLRTVMEQSHRDLLIRPEANLGLRAFHRLNMTVGNIPPVIEPLLAVDSSGLRVKTAVPGATLRMLPRATDLDGDPLKFTWLADPGSGTMATAPDGTRWTLPAANGRYGCTVIASDGKGGYAKSRITLRADGKGVPFSGWVGGTDGKRIANAIIEINGNASGTTDARGWFSLRTSDEKRYVFNIRHPDYAFYSKIYDNGVTGGKWTLTRATVVTFDPARGVEVTNDRGSRDCPGTETARARWSLFPNAARPVWLDGRGNRMSANQLARTPRLTSCDTPPMPGVTPQPQRDPKRPCGAGASVRIPPGSIVDARGNAPGGTLRLAISTVDLASPEQMPGDYTVAAPEGTRAMESFGAAIVDITDAAGQRYNLRSGAAADLVIPVDRTQIAAGASPPPTIPLLFYDEVRGVWIPDGQATLSGDRYVAKVRHFTPFNTDTLKVDQSCVRVLSPALPASYTLEVTIPMGTNAPKVLSKPIDNSAPSEHVIYNLPSNVNIVMVPIDNGVPLGTFVINTGGPQSPTDPNLPAGPPYAACQATAILTPQAYPETPLTGEFLHGLESFNAPNLDELSPGDAAALTLASQAYYAQIDPLLERETLDEFKSKNNFPTNEIRATFANSGDLGFGRDMHCVKNGLDVACYVTNYGDITTPDPDDVQAAVDGLDPVATVAMEFSQIPNAGGVLDDPDRVVKFYVYSADGNSRLNAANLDGYGARPIPQLCMVCHNGGYPGGVNIGVPPFTTRDEVKLGSRFLPFDLRYYTFAASPNKADQQNEFKDLNEQIVLAGNPGDSTTELVAAWYDGSATQLEDAVVTGWNATGLDQSFYRNALSRTCRTCHTAQIYEDLQLQTSAEATNRLLQIESRVCGQHVMPHAKVTHDIFWKSTNPHMPGQLQIFGDANDTGGNWAGNVCGEFISPTPPGQFALLIEPILNTYGCPSCHPPSGSLDLGPGSAYGDLVNEPSVQSALFRVAPGLPDDSYLVHKLQGTQGTVGGTGGRMPQGCTPDVDCLTQTEIDTIRTWIQNGAPP